MDLFERLAAKAANAAMDKAFAKGLMRCPKCGQKPSTAPVDAETLIRCESCGAESLPSEWRPDPQAIPTAHPDQIPAGTRIRREGTGTGECVWHIPASGKFGFFLFFGLFWTGVTAVLSGAFLFDSAAEGQGPEPWFSYPFFAIFWAIGLGTLYVAFRNKYARHRVTVTRDLVTLRREMFGHIKEKSLMTAQVASVAQIVFYQQNYQPVYGVEIRGRDGKLRFGTTLQEAEKAWLVADIKRAVFGETEAGPIAANPPETMAAHRQSSFSFPLPPASKGHWILGVVLILIGMGTIAMGISNGPDLPIRGKDGVDWIAVVFNGVFSLFSLIPVIVGLVFGGIGVLMLSSTWLGQDRETRLEGDEIQVALRTYQHGRVIIRHVPHILRESRQTRQPQAQTCLHPPHHSMRYLLPIIIAPLAFAHPDHGTAPGQEPHSAVRTGNGAWSYEAVPHWGELPDGKIIGPTHGGVVVDDDSGLIYVSTDSELSVIVYQPDGKFVRAIAPECRGFHAMAIRSEDGKPAIYGAQLNGNKPPLRICKIDGDGKLLLEIPNAGTGEVPGGWKGVTGVTVAPDGSIFASMGYGSNTIHKFDATGKLLKSFGSKGEDEQQFNTPHGLAIDARFGDPRLLVVDREKRRLVHLDLEGNWIGVHASQLRRPCAVSILGDMLAVAELEARVTLLDKSGTPIAFLSDNPNKAQWANFQVSPQDQQLGIFTAPHGLSFDKNGNLYVQDWNKTGRVTKLSKL